MTRVPNRRLGRRLGKDRQIFNRSDLRQRFILFLISAVVLVTLFFLLADIFFGELDWPIIVTIIGGVFASGIAYLSFQQTQEIEEARLFHDLFVDFNQRYDKLNEKLNFIYDLCRNNEVDINEEEKQILCDYFNLCGEEYFYYSKGFIYKEAWRAWCVGMNYFLSNSTIRKIWDQEQEEQGGSYYGLTFEHIQMALPESKREIVGI